VSLSGAASALGIPESLVERSAAARATASGTSVDDILAAWAGGETVAAAPPAESETAPAEPETEAPAEPEAEEPAPSTPVIETPASAAPESPSRPVTAPSRAPVPAEVTAAEAAHLPEVVTVPTAGIRERTNFVIPRWLIGLMLVAPLVALFALGGSATGACGEATELTVDVITGEIVNCDGTEFTGGGAGGGAADFVAMGGEIFSGAAVGGVNCAGCHGPNGQGSGTFPALTGVLTTFGSCTDHIEWVRLGSGGWPDSTYGDTNKPVGGAGQMPAFGGSLSDEQIAAVAAFERVRFGGGNPDEVLADCGLAEDTEGEGGEAPADGEEAPADGEEAPADGEEAPADGGQGTATTLPAGG